MRYHDLLVRTWEDCARDRSPYGYYATLSDIHEDTRRAIASDAIRSVARPQHETPQRFTHGKNRSDGG